MGVGNEDARKIFMEMTLNMGLFQHWGGPLPKKNLKMTTFKFEKKIESLDF